MDEISRLLAQHDRLAAELKAVRIELAAYFRSLADGSKPVGSFNEARLPHDGVALEKATRQLGDRVVLRRRSPSLEPHIVDALHKADRPLTRNEILERLTEKGVTVNGQNPKANLSAHLSYSKAVRRTEDGRFELVPKEPEGGKQTPA